MMPPYLVRLWAIGFVLVFRLMFPFEVYQYVFFSFLFGHYLLALLYSRNSVQKQVSDGGGRMRLASLTMIGIAVAYYQMPSTLVCFAFHHMLNETFTPSPGNRTALWARGGLNFLIYVGLLNELPAFSWLPADLVFAAILCCYAVSVFLLIKKTGIGDAKDLLIFETIGLLVVLAVPAGVARFEDLAFYHVAYWLIFPLVRSKQVQSGLARYVSLTAGVTAVFWFLTPAAGFASGEMWNWIYWSNFFGSLHISASFLLSNWNPRWLRTLAASS
jgi:hypothetical protein